MNLDDELRAWGAEARQTAPPVDPAPIRRAPRVRTLAAVVAAIVVVAAAVSVPLAVRHDGSRSSGSTPTTTARAADVQTVTFFGLTIDVPKAWPRNATQCGTATQNTVITEPDAAACARGRPAGLTTVEFFSFPTFELMTNGYLLDASAPKRAKIEQGRIDGHDAQIWTYTADGLIWHGVIVDDLDVGVVIAAPDATTVDHLSDTLRVSRADDNGCISHDTRSPVLTDGQSPTRPGADELLVPGDPQSLSVCTYYRGGLANGIAVNDADLRRVVDQLNAVPAGLSYSNPRDFLPSLCPASGGINDPFALGEDAYWTRLRADYAQGPDVIVTVRLGLCGDLGASNGSRTAQRTQQLIQILTPYSGFGGGYQDSVLKR